MTTSEVAELLKVKPETLYRDKQLKATKRFGKKYYNRADVMAYIGVKPASNV